MYGAASMSWHWAGGVIFAADHIIQANVPPENVMAMWETLQE
jgi:hypothetical protein